MDANRGLKAVRQTKAFYSVSAIASDDDDVVDAKRMVNVNAALEHRAPVQSRRGTSGGPPCKGEGAGLHQRRG